MINIANYRYNDYMKYHYFRVYGEFESEPDKYGALTFKVAEWYPLKKYVAIKDKIEWDKYKIVNSILIKCNIALLIIVIIASKVQYKVL
ncbi:hypothetical protein [Clostridium sp. HBUAS56017]|uniref:hypothetical protein n=1 Tax=Clostridium sp. HBUAS56017 TaxID=2571128 RepID=UPI0011774AA3|nr:hypothetical protein [Clostridium sp. HBUAS56017]